MSQITTHVLDVSIGQPAVGISVTLEIETTDSGWKELSRGATDGDGRVRHLLAPGSLVEGTYRLRFGTHAYFDSRKIKGLYPEVSVTFSVRNAKDNYHIPLLLSPFGYTTYRGS